MSMKYRTIAALALVLLLPAVATAQDTRDTKERQATPANKTCLVSDEPIPAGAPTSKVRDVVVAFCCKRCKAKFDGNPREYTDKIDALRKGSQERMTSGYAAGRNKIAHPDAYAKAMEKPIFSGPQKGESLLSFTVVGLHGDDKGKEYDPVARAGNDMQVLLFTKGTSGGRIVPLLSSQLDAIMKGSGKTWRASVVHLSDNPNELSPYLSKYEGRVAGFCDMGVAKEGASGPGTYGLDRTVTHTFLFAKNGKVVHNLVFPQQVLFSEPHLLGAIADVMEVDHETLGKWLDTNMKGRSASGSQRRTFTPEQRAFRMELAERLQRGEITREEAGRLYREKFPDDPGIRRSEEDKKKEEKKEEKKKDSKKEQ